MTSPDNMVAYTKVDMREVSNMAGIILISLPPYLPAQKGN
jgi:hypothetical protein